MQWSSVEYGRSRRIIRLLVLSIIEQVADVQCAEANSVIYL